MSVNDKLKNAKNTNWLAENLENEEIHEIKTLALIAAKIQLKRLEMGMNQKEFAKAMGVSQGMVSRWESGEYNFSILTLNEICKKLKLEFIPVIRDRRYKPDVDFKTIPVSVDSRKSVPSPDIFDGTGMEVIA